MVQLPSHLVSGQGLPNRFAEGRDSMPEGSLRASLQESDGSEYGSSFARGKGSEFDSSQHSHGVARMIDRRNFLNTLTASALLTALPAAATTHAERPAPGS